MFRDIGTPQGVFPDKSSSSKALVSQPVTDAADTLYVLQGNTLFTVSPDGTKMTKSAPATGVSATTPVSPVMDGAGNLYLIDNRNKLFVFRPDLKPGNSPQTLSFTGLNPGLLLAPDGSLFTASNSTLYRVRPGVKADVTVKAYADRTSYRATSLLVLGGAAVPAGGSLVFQSGGSIEIQPGFSFPVGAQARFGTGY